MRNITLRWYKNIGIIVLSFLILSVIWLTVIIEKNENISTMNNLFRFAIEHHIVILVILVVIAVAFGFLWANILYHQIEKKEEETKSILDIVVQFLHNEEKQILNYLVDNKGTTTQAEIARLPSMNRVKAFRTLQKMEEKRLIEIIPHGKIRKIMLKENILDIISKKE
ncbi:hypothetical protein HYY69_03455 [Candidatus Woesearchaeota archaeon]|nr:hypothetical protein [Candidatus Woesearchaeota archaeon]